MLGFKNIRQVIYVAGYTFALSFFMSCKDQDLPKVKPIFKKEAPAYVKPELEKFGFDGAQTPTPSKRQIVPFDNDTTRRLATESGSGLY